MRANKYQREAMRTNDGRATERLIRQPIIDKAILDYGGVINASLGLSGEVGELNDMIKKWIFHEQTICLEDLQKELGDVMWYVALFCESMHWDMEDVMKKNIDKLKKRYPEGFDVTRAHI